MNFTSTFQNFEGIIRISARFADRKNLLTAPNLFLKQ